VLFMYIYPTDERGISDSFMDHVNRGSVNPGVDYTCRMGMAVFSVSNGYITDASNDNGGGGGRTIHINHDDGTGADYLHLDSVAVNAGNWVGQGTILGYTGASGYGDDYYYGAHLHISFRPNHSGGYGNNNNQDFQAIMDAQGSGNTGGDTEPIRGADKDMPNFYKTTDGTLWYGAYACKSMDVYDVLVRYDASTADNRDTFNPQQQDWIDEALKANSLKA
jgi:murein DD-endopeptidase MepM/ murein hydrolase activator NlpD